MFQQGYLVTVARLHEKEQQEILENCLMLPWVGLYTERKEAVVLKKDVIFFQLLTEGAGYSS